MENIKNSVFIDNRYENDCDDELGHSSGYLEGDGYGSGEGFGYGFDDGSGNGFGSGSGAGSRLGYGSGSGDDPGIGGRDGSGSGYGYATDIKSINGQQIYNINDTGIIIGRTKHSIAKGLILKCDLTTEPCYVAKRNNIFEYGKTLQEAIKDLNKHFITQQEVEIDNTTEF